MPTPPRPSHETLTPEARCVVTGFQDTPNPHAVKCVLHVRPPELSAGPVSSSNFRSYREASQCVHDPLAAALFAVPGVVGVLIHSAPEGSMPPAWITITKDARASWVSVKAGVQKVLVA